jgi:hypothetical protein
MRLSFNFWELSLTFVMKRYYILNEIIRREKRNIYQISLGDVRIIKPIHHLILEDPLERIDMSRNRDDYSGTGLRADTNNPRALKFE